jgi:hypothetical protein
MAHNYFQSINLAGHDSMILNGGEFRAVGPTLNALNLAQTLITDINRYSNYLKSNME